MASWTSEVWFIPTKRRPRFTKSGRAYDPKENRDEAAMIRDAYGDGPLFDGPVMLNIAVYSGMPGSGKKDSEPFTVKPDADNIAKAIADALQGGRGIEPLAFNDDKQIVCLIVCKHDRRKGETSRTVFTVSEM